METVSLLIVEDEIILADDMRSQLSECGYRVLGIEKSGEAALNAMHNLTAQGQTPQVVLLDIRLSGAMDGIQVARQINQLYDSTVIFLTGLSDPHIFERSLATKPYAFLLKPFDRRQAQITIQLALYQRELELALKRRQSELEMLNRQLERHLQERTALYQITALINQYAEMRPIAEQALPVLLEAIKGEYGIIHISEDRQAFPSDDSATEKAINIIVQAGFSPLNLSQPSLLGDWLWNRVLTNGQPLIIPDLREEDQFACLLSESGKSLSESLAYIGIPIQTAGIPNGVISLFRRATLPFQTEEMDFLTNVAVQFGVALERERLQRLTEQTAVNEERQRLGRELHDSLTQSIYSLTLFTDAGLRFFANGQWEQVRHMLERIKATAEQSLKEMRLLVHALRPSQLASEGLSGAIQFRLDAVEKRLGLEAKLFTEVNKPIPPYIEEELYGLTLEALNNVLKHARASRVYISLHANEELVSLQISDDGTGFEPAVARQSGGMGLESMHKRVEKIKGTLVITSIPGQGTKVTVNVPR